ncbi:MAG: trimethylamine methyltransferase family protein [Candidatus Aminicenantes bacterium RBG_16_66_30]
MSQVKPVLRVLSDEAVARVHHVSLKILAEVGVRVESSRARDLLLKASGGLSSASEGGDCRTVRLPAPLIEWALRATPSEVSIFTRDRRLAFSLGPEAAGGTRFGIGVTNLRYQDPADDRVVPFTREHQASSTRLGDALSAFDVVSTIGVPQDLPPDSADLYGTLEMAANTLKPLVLLVAEERAFVPVLDLLEELCGEMGERPFVVPYFNPVTPLVINAGTSDKMFAAIERGLPIIYSNYGMSGATTPITPAGTLALLNAELLAGLVLAQLMREGAPVIVGSLPAGFDMKGMMSYYGAETMLLNLACAEMMANYRLPHCGTSGSGAGWGPDLPAADLFWMNHLTSLVGRSGLAPFVGGNFDSLAFSPAAAVYADHVIGLARRFAAGFALDDANLGLAEIFEAGPGGDYFGAGLTMANFRTAAYESPVFPRMTLAGWEERQGPKALDFLRERTVSLLAGHRPPADHDDLIGRGEELARKLTPTAAKP